MFAVKVVAKPFVYGTGSGPAYIDPANAWDEASLDVIEQCCEGLVMYNLSAPLNPLIPVLATNLGVWSVDGLSVNFTLRQGVTFSDGWAFNATAVKWNFDRIAGLLDSLQTASLL